MLTKYIHVGNVSIFCRIYGKGFPVVLLHGFGEDGSVWEEQSAILSAEYLVIVPDLPGSGSSDALDGEPCMEDFAGHLCQMLKLENIGSCIMIGHSMGGYITLAFAEQFPELLHAYGLFHSSAYADQPEKVIQREKAIEFIEKNGALAFLKTSIPGLFMDQVESEFKINRLLKKGAKFTPGALKQYYHAMIQRPDRTEILQSSKIPVLFVLGQHDKAVPFSQGLQQTHLAFCTYIYVLRNSAHMGMLEETARSNEILSQFIRSAISGV
jgi:pimeloyl-ACP methyl ester carboxylesterase